MPDTLQRRRPVASAGMSGRPRHRVRTSSGRDWAPTRAQTPMLPAPRVSTDPPTTPRLRGSGRQRDWTPTPVMLPLPVALIPAPRRHEDIEDIQQAAPAARPAGTRLLRGVALVVLNVVLLGAVAVFAGLALGPRTGHYQTLTMLTGSMRPQFPPGSVVVVTREPVEDVRPGHVITFHAPTEDRRVVTHRIVSIDRSGDKPVLITKGDANVGNDPWEAALNEPYVWRARFAVPLLGDAIRQLRQPTAQLVATRVVPGALLVWLLVSIWRGDSKDA